MKGLGRKDVCAQTYKKRKIILLRNNDLQIEKMQRSPSRDENEIVVCLYGSI